MLIRVGNPPGNPRGIKVPEHFVPGDLKFYFGKVSKKFQKLKFESANSFKLLAILLKVEIAAEVESLFHHFNHAYSAAAMARICA